MPCPSEVLQLLAAQVVVKELTMQQVPAFLPRARTGTISEQISNPDWQCMLKKCKCNHNSVYARVLGEGK